MNHLKKFSFHVWPYLLILILAYGSFRSLLAPGFFPVHDDTQVARVYEMAKALSDGQIPVRWVSDLGYGFGYPLFNFYAPLPYYFGGILNIIGFDAVVATKLMFLFGVVFASLSMFWLGRALYGTWAGILASIFYTYAPYRALDIYVRGAVGEFWVMAFLPLFFLGVFYLLTRKIDARSFLMTSLSLAAIMLCHNITAMLVVAGTTIFIFIYFIYLCFKGKKFRSFWVLLLAVALALSISAFFWLPALTEKDHTSVYLLTTGGVNYHDHFVYLDQLWDSAWGYGGSASGRADGLSFKIGKLPIIIATLSLFSMILVGRRDNLKKVLLVVFLSIILITVFMSLSISLPVWEHLPLLAYVQFPWRFLLFVPFSISLMCGSWTCLFRQSQMLIVLLLSFLIILYNAKYFVPKNFETRSVESYLNIEELQWRISKVSDEYLPLSFKRPHGLSEIRGNRLIESDNVQVVHLNDNSTRHIVAILNSQAQTLTLDVTDFPGWRVLIDDIPVKTFDSGGKISFFLPAGKVKVSATFNDTPVRIVSNILSVISIVLVFAIHVQKKITS